MASHRLKRGFFAAIAVASVGLTSAPAIAQPPATAADALKKYNELSEQATKLNEDVLRAQEDLDKKKGELDKANADVGAAQRIVDQAKADEETFRVHVDKLTEASFQGARFNSLSALLVSESQQDFLNRMSALGILAADNTEALAKLSGAVDRANQARQSAQDAQTRASDATKAAEQLRADLDKRNTELQTQIREVKAAMNGLSAGDKAKLGDKGDMSNIKVPPGTAGAALAFALAQRGDGYRYGATGPDWWDCAGLTMKAYEAAGMRIPRTSGGQAGVGRAVSRGDVQPGDLIIYYSSQSHVAMAVDNQNAVHASTEGVPVRIAPIDSIGPISVIRRIEG
ncbi:hydrolase Nlp/P60 [Lentzea sp. NBRC 105346]|uniref:C40 family peptidase n=1 Tax=Lentzea sp. NBRC 105346 TaxID=3032205 RepID=UPI0024A521DD|nr:NlpC/P60 family protein [Lentzea sp. NBRC 105346]GLZ34292.1 hydrolase Nlp/P60 [Lentzea sp. NBRC 105346]